MQESRAGFESGAAGPERETQGERSMRSAFVFTAMMAIVGFVLVQVALGEQGGRGGVERLKQLMATTRAELVELPLTPTQATWPLSTGQGQTFTLGSLPKDTLVFLNFWATWCPPCREELPSMLQLREQLRDRRFMMVAVSYDDAFSDIDDFFSRWIGRMPAANQLLVVKDEQLEPGRTLRETFGTTQMPDTYVIMNGQVLARFVNARNWTSPQIVEYFQTLAPAL